MLVVRELGCFRAYMSSSEHVGMVVFLALQFFFEAMVPSRGNTQQSHKKPKVFRGAWYMANFGARTAKRHIAWTNCEAFIKGIVDRGGYLSDAERQRLGPSDLTVRTWDGSTGKVRFTGNRAPLKNSQLLGLWIMLALLLLVLRRTSSVGPAFEPPPFHVRLFPPPFGRHIAEIFLQQGSASWLAAWNKCCLG